MQAQKRKTPTFYSLGRRQRHRRSYVSSLDSGASMHNAEQGELSSDTMHTLRRSKKHKQLTATGGSANKRVSTSFFSLSRSVRNSAITRWNAQRFYCFISFAQNADIHMSGKRRNSTIDQNEKTITCTITRVLLVVSRLSSYSSSILSSTSRSKDQL